MIIAYLNTLVRFVYGAAIVLYRYESPFEVHLMYAGADSLQVAADPLTKSIMLDCELTHNLHLLSPFITVSESWCSFYATAGWRLGRPEHCSEKQPMPKADYCRGYDDERNCRRWNSTSHLLYIQACYR